MTEATVTSISALLDSVRAIANDVIAPEGAKVDRERRYPGEGLRALAEVGALGLLCGSEHGGAAVICSRLRSPVRRSAQPARRPAWCT
jgi:alkylation response protein AidB-like acyl-CoA dehydrogenase